MNTLLYLAGIGLVRLLQAMPLRAVARLGRLGGGAAWFLDARHRRAALRNLAMCFGAEKSPAEIRALARENFRRIGENYASAVKTTSMAWEDLKPHVEFIGAERLPQYVPGTSNNIVIATAHFGNFELSARFRDLRRDWQCATTFRALDLPGLNRVLLSLRSRSGCLFFERRTDSMLLRETMNRGGVILGLASDQNARGFRGPFLGHECNTGLSPAVFALRYNALLYTAVCFRTSLAHWRLELGPLIPTHDEKGMPRPSEDIMRDVNRDYEIAIRRDPANWFWVHRRWKS